MKIKLLQNFGVLHGGVKTGDILEARKLNRNGLPLDSQPDLQILEGPGSGLLIPFHCAVVIDEEPSVSLSQFKDLKDLNEAALEQNKILKGQLNKALADIAEHGRTIVELQQELVNEREGKKKVEIPREVAEAIEQLRESDLSDHGIMHFIDRSNDVVDSKRRESFKVLRRFTFLDSAHYTNGCDFLMNALVNGYTIEQSPEEKLAEGITDICTRFDDEHPDDVEYEDLVSLAFEISDFVQEHINN